MNKRHRAVLVGCGSMSGTWLTALRDHFSDQVEIVGMVDLFEEAARNRANEFALTCPVGSSLEVMLKGVKPDLVFNCTIPEAHAATCHTALTAGCHVLVEKPLAPSVAASRELERTATAAHRTLAVIQNRRYLPGAIEVRRALAQGLIGKINAVYVDFFLAPHFGGFRESMQHPLLEDMAIHAFDHSRFFTGANALRVTCQEFNPTGSWFAHGASAAAFFEMEDQIVFGYRGSWCARGFPTSWAGSWRFIGERGTLLWDGELKIDVELLSVAAAAPSFMEPVERLALDPKAQAPAEIEHAGNIGEFLRSIASGCSPQTCAADNLKSVAMVEAAIESAQQGGPVILP